MKILLVFDHPAHFYLFRNFYKYLKNNKIDVTVIARRKDVLLELLEYENIDYKQLSKSANSVYFYIIEFFLRLYGIIKLQMNEGFKLAFGTSELVPLLTLFFKDVTSLYFNEDDDDVVKIYSYLTAPFATKIINPVCLKSKKWQKKRILHNTYHELAYLHPNNFTPDVNVLKKYNLTEREYIVVRFSAFRAHHDIGEHGLSSQLWKRIKILCNGYRIVKSLEDENSHQVAPWDMHHVLAFSKILISDSQTMTAEASVLGVPTVRYNSFVGRISYLEELEHKYYLTFGFRPGQEDKMIEKINDLLNQKNIYKKWHKRRMKMLSEKIDFNDWMVRYFNTLI